MLNVNKYFAVLVAVFSASGYATTQDEINHLLDYAGSTHCSYERNGTMHSGEEAVIHIKNKYDYFSDDIESAEDFIKYSATKSKISGKFYTIHCPDSKPVNSQDWLLAELRRYRFSIK